MPATSKKFLAKVARPVCWATVPRLARKIFGALAGLLLERLGGVPQLLEALGQAMLWAAAACVADFPFNAPAIWPIVAPAAAAATAASVSVARLCRLQCRARGSTPGGGALRLHPVAGRPPRGEQVRLLGSQRRLQNVGELADAGHRVTPLGERGLALRPGVGDLLGEAAVLQDGENAARLLDGLELRPGDLGQFVGAALHVPGAAGGIDHLGEVGFFGEDDVGVAGDPPAQLVGQGRVPSRTAGR